MGLAAFVTLSTSPPAHEEVVTSELNVAELTVLYDPKLCRSQIRGSGLHGLGPWTQMLVFRGVADPSFPPQCVRKASMREGQDRNVTPAHTGSRTSVGDTCHSFYLEVRY